MDSGILPQDWHKLNDLWYDYFNIRAEETGNEALKKLGRNGIVRRSYKCVGSLRLPGAEVLEQSGIHIDSITEEEYARLLTKVPVRERKALEETLCKTAGVEPLDLLVASGGRLTKLKPDDTWVFKNGQEKPVKLLEDMHPDIKEALENEAKRQAVSVRFYAREECAQQVAEKIFLIIATFRKLIAA
jgi:hypothetical protein